MFMDRQELKYSLKFIKGDIKQRGLQNIFGITFLALFSIVNVVMSCLDIFLNESTSINIVNFQDFSGSALFAMVMFPIIYYICTYQKNTMANLIYPQTNNTRFVKDFLVGFGIVLLLIAIYIFSYFVSFGLGHLISFIRTDTVVSVNIEPFYLLLSCFSLLMYGLLALSFFILCGAVVRKIKLYSLAFPLVFVLLLSTMFQETVNMLVEMAKFYTSEGSILAFALKILVTFAVFMLLAFIINNKTSVENNVNYKNFAVISIVVLLVLASSVSGFFILSINFVDDGYTLEPEVDTYEMDDVYQKIEIDISDIEIGTYMSLHFSGVVDYDEYTDKMYMRKGNYDSTEPLITTSHKLVVYYNFIESSDELNFDIQDYTNESFTAYVEDETLHLIYEIDKAMNLININSSFLINQFDITENNSYYSSFSYIQDASCFIAFE